jgi:hypothetical protein
VIQPICTNPDEYMVAKRGAIQLHVESSTSAILLLFFVDFLLLKKQQLLSTRTIVAVLFNSSYPKKASSVNIKGRRRDFIFVVYFLFKIFPRRATKGHQGIDAIRNFSPAHKLNRGMSRGTGLLDTVKS